MRVPDRKSNIPSAPMAPERNTKLAAPLFVLPLVFIALLCNCGGIPARQISERAKAQIDSIFIQLGNSHSPGCVLGILHNGNVLYERAWGMADIENRIPATGETAFYVGSIAKQFIGFLICLRVESRRIGLDNSVTSYLKDFPELFSIIKVRDLLYHSSGIADYEKVWLDFKKDSLPDKSPENVCNLLKSMKKLSFEPGKKYEYSNSNYFLLGTIIETLDNRKLGEILEDEIFSVLNMSNTFCVDVHSDRIPATAPSYFINDKGNFEKAPFKQMLVGAGGMFSTLNDMAKWDFNYYHNRIGHDTPGIIRLWEKSGTLKNGKSAFYAAGIIPWKHKGDKVLMHEGGYYAYRAAVVRYTKRKMSIILLSNFSDIKAGETACRIGDILFDK